MTHGNKEDKEIQLDQVFSFYLKPVINSFDQNRLEILKPKLNSSFFFRRHPSENNFMSPKDLKTESVRREGKDF